MNLFKKYMKEKKPSDHAELSASAAERWMNCRGQPNLARQVKTPVKDNEASIRGTNTHTLLQFILENKKWKRLLKHVQAKRFLEWIGYDRAMLTNALFAAEYVWAEKARMEKRYGCEVSLFTEQKLELEGVGFGTSDVILYHPYGLLHVMDYKNGVKAVEPENNWQGLYYAHGAADKFGWEFSKLHITIIQPNAPHSRGHIRTWKTDEVTLARAGLLLKKGAAATKKKNAPLVKNDSWCWFCPAREICPLQRELKVEKYLERFNEVEEHYAG